MAFRYQGRPASDQSNMNSSTASLAFGDRFAVLHDLHRVPIPCENFGKPSHFRNSGGVVRLCASGRGEENSSAKQPEDKSTSHFGSPHAHVSGLCSIRCAVSQAVGGANTACRRGELFEQRENQKNVAARAPQPAREPCARPGISVSPVLLFGLNPIVTIQ